MTLRHDHFLNRSATEQPPGRFRDRRTAVNIPATPSKHALQEHVDAGGGGPSIEPAAAVPGARGSRGSVERHTAQSHPSVGTPMEVPLPSTVRVAFIFRWFQSQARAVEDAPAHS